MSVELNSKAMQDQDGDTVWKRYPILVPLSQALSKAWSKDTSISPTYWSRQQPSTGQCAVTALVINNYLGGEIMRCDIQGGISHYWNMLDDIYEVDLTAVQFDGLQKRIGCAPVSRIKLLQNQNTKMRYELLLQRVRKYLDTAKISQ